MVNLRDLISYYYYIFSCHAVKYEVNYEQKKKSSNVNNGCWIFGVKPLELFRSSIRLFLFCVVICFFNDHYR